MKKSLSLLFFFAFVSLFTTSTFAAVKPISIPKPVPVAKPLPVSVKLLTPTNFENLNEDSQYTIKWESKNIPADAKIILDIYNGGKDITSPNTQIAILSATATSYTWTVKGNNGWGVGMVTPFERVAKLFGIESAYAGASNYTIGIRVVTDKKGQLAFDTSKPFFINPAITIPTAKFTTDPTLKLSFDSKKKTPMIEGYAVVEISAPTNSDTKIYTVFSRIMDKNGNHVYTNATDGVFDVISGATKEVVDQSPDFSGNTVYKIKAGEKAKFKVTITDNPEFMFGGVYKMSVVNISFVKPNSNGGYDYDFTTIVPPSKTSNALAVVGEKGPYISGTNSPIPLEKDVVVTGVRFGKSKSDNIIFVSGVKKGGIASKDGKTIVIPRDWFTGAFGKSNGVSYDNIQIENPKLGKSNIVFVEIKSAVNLSPVITNVASPAAGDFEIDSEGKVMITGSNLFYKDSAEVYIGGQKAIITQYGSDLMYVTAPKLALGSYDMYLITSVGKSNIVKVKVITSTTGIDLTSTCPTTKFERELVVGSSGNDVVALQTFLYSKGYSVGVATGYFGTLTKSSLAAYQVAKGITPSDGVFGPISRASVTADCNPIINPITVSMIKPLNGQVILMDDYFPAQGNTPGQYLAQEEISARVSGGSGNYKTKWKFNNDKYGEVGGYDAWYFVNQSVFTVPYVFNNTGTWEVVFEVTDDLGNKSEPVVTKVYLQNKAPSINLLNPNGGEALKVGDTHRIKWNSVGAEDTVDIMLKGCKSCGSNIVLSAPNIGYYDWVVKGSVNSPDGQYKIDISSYDKVSNNGNWLIDESDNYFTINSATTTASITVLNPNGGEVWNVGETKTIKYSSSNISNHDFWIYLERFVNGSSVSSYLITTFSQPNGEISYTPSQDVINALGGTNGNYKIRIWSDAIGYPQDYSDNYFTINPAVQTNIPLSIGNTSASYSLTTGGPNGDTIGAAVTFKFTATNLNDFDIYISKIPGVALETSTTGSAGSPATASSTITYVTSNPSTFAADTGTAPTSGAYVIPAGSSRTLTYSGSLDNTNGTAGIRVFKITAIRYGTSATNTAQHSLTSNLDGLVVTPSLTGGYVYATTTTTSTTGSVMTSQISNATSTMISVIGTSTPLLTPVNFIVASPTLTNNIELNLIPQSINSLSVINLSATAIIQPSWNTTLATTSLRVAPTVIPSSIPVWGTN